MLRLQTAAARFGGAIFAILLASCASTPSDSALGSGAADDAPPASTAAATTSAGAAPTATAAEPPEVAAPLSYPVLRTTFFPDDSVDVYTEFHYGDRIGGGAGSAAAERDLDLLEEVTFDHAGELVSRVRYDYAEGLLIAESASDDADELTATHSYEYNAGSNLVVSDTATDARDRVRSISLYQYDTEGRRTEWRLLGRDRVLLGYTQYEYVGSAASAAHNFNAAGVLQETLSYVRDGQGRVLEERVTAAQGGELTRSEYAYAGDLPRATSYFSASQLVGVEEYAYDADGNRTSIRTLGGDGTLKTRIAVEYQTAAQIEAQR